MRLKKSTKLRYALVQLSEDYVRPVSSENLGHGLLSPAHLIRVTEYELAGFERLFLRITARDTAALDCGVADTVSVSERFRFGWKSVAVLSPNGLDS
jgi:hypothetical protein